MHNFPIELKIGDKVFVRTFFNWKKPKTYLSWIIRPIAKLWCNHVRVVVEKDGKLGFLEAVERGVVFNDLYYHPTKESIIVKRNKFIPNIRRYNSKLLLIEGKKYDGKTLVVVELIWNLFGIWIGASNETKAMKRFICYEVGFYADKYILGWMWWFCKPKIYFEGDFMYTIFKD